MTGPRARRVRPALSADDRRRARGRRVRFALGTGAAVLLFLALVLPLRGFVADDTFIHLQFARNFRDGHGLVFNAGQPVYGTTSPLWSLLLGALARLAVAAGVPLDLLLLARGLSVLFGALAVLAVAVALRRFLEAFVSEHGHGAARGELAWALGTLVFACDGWFVRFAASGMETSLGVFLVVLGFAATFRRRPWGARVLAPAVAWSLASLVRPEAALLIVLLVLRVALSRSAPALKLRRCALVLLPAACVHGPWLAYAYALYGTVVPATLAAKAAGGQGPAVALEFLRREALILGATRGVEMLVLLAFLPLLLPRLWRERAEHFLPAGWTFGLPVLYALRGVNPITRYFVPLAPGLLFYGWGTLAAVSVRARRKPAFGIAVLGLAALLSFGLNGWTLATRAIPQARAFGPGVIAGLGGLGAWCRENTPPGSAVAIPDIGAFAYYGDRPVVDLAGLVTPAITPLLEREGYDTMVVGLHFEGVARPPYLVDRADRAYRMMTDSPFAPCLTPLRVERVDWRSMQHPGPSYYTLYRIDWSAFDRMAGGVRQAALRPAALRPAASRTPRA